LTENQPELLKLIFNELQGDYESLENATNCVIELILLAKKKEEFIGIRMYVINNIEKFTTKV